MKLLEKYVSHDFLIVASVLLLSAVFNRTILRLINDYENFATAAATTTADKPITIQDLKDRDSWVAYFSSRAFWFPSGPTILLILVGFGYLLMNVIRKPAAIRPVAF